MVFLAQLSEGAGSMPTPLHFIYPFQSTSPSLCSSPSNRAKHNMLVTPFSTLRPYKDHASDVTRFIPTVSSTEMRKNSRTVTSYCSRLAGSPEPTSNGFYGFPGRTLLKSGNSPPPPPHLPFPSLSMQFCCCYCIITDWKD